MRNDVTADNQPLPAPEATIGCGDRIAGALLDFLGYLVSLPVVIEIGAWHNAGPMMDALKTWANLRELSLDNALVQEWQQETFIHAIVTSNDMTAAQAREWVGYWLEHKEGQERLATPLAQQASGMGAGLEGQTPLTKDAVEAEG